MQCQTPWVATPSVAQTTSMIDYGTPRPTTSTQRSRKGSFAEQCERHIGHWHVAARPTYLDTGTICLPVARQKPIMGVADNSRVVKCTGTLMHPWLLCSIACMRPNAVFQAFGRSSHRRQQVSIKE